MNPSSLDMVFTRLSSSKFRASFYLDKAMCIYAVQKGQLIIKQHAEDFVSTRLAPAQIQNDGRQTPMKGHPVFLAQHACACCCRSCLKKWYGVPKGRGLTEREQAAIVAILMRWIEREVGDEFCSKASSDTACAVTKC